MNSRLRGLTRIRLATRVLVPPAIVVGTIMVSASPAAADNCSGLSDCSAGVKITFVVIGILLMLLAWWLIAELAAAAAKTEAEAEAATHPRTDRRPPGVRAPNIVARLDYGPASAPVVEETSRMAGHQIRLLTQERYGPAISTEEWR